MNKVFLLICVVLFALPSSAHADDLDVLATTTPESPALQATSTPFAPEDPVHTSDLTASTTASTTAPTDSATTTTRTIPEAVDPVSITLVIATHDGIIFEGPLLVPACLPEVATVSGYCALEASGVPVIWSWYEDDAFLDTLGGVGNDYAAGAYWNWFSDHTYGTSALNSHVLHDDESLVVTIGPLPLRLVFDTDTFISGSTTTVSVLAFAFDANFEPVWVPAEGSTIEIRGETFPTGAGGTLSFVPTEGRTEFVARHEGHLQEAVTKNVMAVSVTDPSTGGGDAGSVVRPADAAGAARAFLLSHQGTDGSFSNTLLTDWAAIALSSTSGSTKALKEFLTSMPVPRANATDLERRSMALTALGIDPYLVVEGLMREFDGAQIGNPALINDDIFGIIALTHAGYSSRDAVIMRTVETLLARQAADGSFESTDLTAAAIQALARARSLPGVADALARARTALIARQQQDGCFGNSSATSWSIMAIISLGESSDAWRTASGNTPRSCLTLLQSPDGGFDESADADMRAWATAYALPALQDKDWHSLLHSFARHETTKEEEADTIPGNTEEVLLDTPLPAIAAIEPAQPVATEPVAVPPPEVLQRPSATAPAASALLAGVAAAPLEQEAGTKSFLERWFSTWGDFFRMLYERLVPSRLFANATAAYSRGL